MTAPAAEPRRVYETDADTVAALTLLRQTVMGEDVVIQAEQMPGLTGGLLAIAANLLGRVFSDPGSDGKVAALRWIDWRIRQDVAGGGSREH